MKKIISIFFLAFITIVAGIFAWVAYSFNAESYKEQLVSAISKVTGRTVEVSGPVSLSWRPFPMLVLSNLTVSNQEDSKNPVMFSVEEMKAEVEWASLFKRPLVIKKVVLQRPKILLERIRSYQTNFDFPILFKMSQAVDDKSFMEGNSDLSLRIDDIEVKEGEFTYINNISGDAFSVSNISGNGRMDSLDGPFSFMGNTKFNELAFDIDLKIDEIEISRPVKFTLVLTDESSKTSIKTTEASVFYDPQKPSDWMKIAGTIRSEKPGLLFKKMGLAECPPGKIFGSFSLKLMTEKTMLDSLSLQHGEGDVASFFFLGMRTQKDGDKEKTMPTFILRNLDYDQWKIFVQQVLTFPSFSKLSTEIYAQVEDILINSETIKNGLMVGNFEKGILSILNLNFQLPHNSSIEAKGTLGINDKSIDVDVQFQSAEFRSFLKWLWDQENLSFLPENGIKNFQWDGHIKKNSESLSFQTNAGVLDDTQFSGNLEMRGTETTNVEMNVKKLNINFYFKLNELLKKIKLLSKEFNFDLKGEEFMFNNYLFKQVELKGNLKENVLNLSHFSIAGSDDYTFDGKGIIENLFSENLLLNGLDMNFQISTINPFKKDLSSVLDISPFEKISDVKGQLSYNGSLKNGNFKTNMDFNKGKLAAEGILEEALTQPKFRNLTFSLEYPEIQNFLFLTGKAKRFFPYLKGEFKISLLGNGDVNNFTTSNFSAQIGKQILNGQLIFSIKDTVIKADLTTKELNLNLFLPDFKDVYSLDATPFSFQLETEWQTELKIKSENVLYSQNSYRSFLAEMKFKDQILSISKLDFEMPKNRGKISSSGTATFRTPFVLEGKLNVSQLDLNGKTVDMKIISLKNGKLTLGGGFSISGNSWENCIRNLRGQGNAAWVDGTIQGIDMAELSSTVDKALNQHQYGESVEIQIKHGLNNGETNFTSLSGDFKIDQAVINFDQAKGVTQFGEFFLKKLSYILIKQKIDALLSVHLMKNLPSLEIDIQNNLSKANTEAFNKALEQEVNSLIEQQKKEEKDLADKEAKIKQDEILKSAKAILEKSESQLKKMKDAVALNSSLEAQKLTEEAERAIADVRQLAIRSDLNGEQLNILRERAEFLSIQSDELEALLERQNILKQREAVQKLPFLVKARLEELSQLYQQNPQSTILAGLVQGSKKEEENIMKILQELPKINNMVQLKSKVEEVKESFQKIQKALNYARQLDMNAPTVPNVSGSISGGI